MKTLKKSFHMLLPAICCLVWLSAAQAQPKGENIFIIHDAVGQPDSLITMYVEIINQDYFMGFQFDIPLPSGLSYVSGSAWLNPARRVNHVIQATILPGTNILRALAYTFSGVNFIGNSGLIATFKLNTSAQIVNYQLISENVIIENANGQNLVTVSIHSTVFITPYGSVPGDSNGDGIVNLFDVISTLGYIQGNIPEFFCYQNASLSTNHLLITVADVIGTVNIILGLRSDFLE